MSIVCCEQSFKVLFCVGKSSLICYFKCSKCRTYSFYKPVAKTVEKNCKLQQMCDYFFRLSLVSLVCYNLRLANLREETTTNFEAKAHLISLFLNRCTEKTEELVCLFSWETEPIVFDESKTCRFYRAVFLY